MALAEMVSVVRHWASWRPVRRRGGAVGGSEVADARRLADAERAAGTTPDGCAWLDDRTVDDLDLPRVFGALDRTVTPTGAQVLWRWLAAPAVRLDVLADRERALARLAARPALRGELRGLLGGHAASDAAHLPRLLWEPAPPPLALGGFAALTAAVIALGVLAIAWWPPLVIGCLALVIVNVLIDDWASLVLARQGLALGVLGQRLAVARRVIARGVGRDLSSAGGRDAASAGGGDATGDAGRDTTGHAIESQIADDLAVLEPFRRRIAWLSIKDAFGLADLLRGGLLLRILVLGTLMHVVERERVRLVRVVLWLGELDAQISVASLRAERADARLPSLTAGDTGRLAASDLVHPAITGAVGNDVVLDAGLIVTGSNMSGKSTFLRTLAVNAICAQSIHTTFGGWRASLFRVHAVMRTVDTPADGMSKYAVEVAAIGTLVDAVARPAGTPALPALPAMPALPALLVIDEPFSGTNPALRVPIVVTVLDHLGDRDLVIAATHDLAVAAEVDPRFQRGYFCEPDDGTGRFDRKLRPGVSPGSNALALLVRAGYPPAVIAAVERRMAARG